MNVSGQVFVVTGAGSGIGQHVARQLAEQGGQVALVDRSAARLDALPGVLAPGASGVCHHVVDVTDAGAVDELVAAVLGTYGRVDGILNVAGVVQPFLRVAELDRAAAERVMAVNFWGTYNMCTAFLPALRTRPQAAIVNVASMGGFTPVPGQTLYGASKAAVKLFTEGLYAELRGTSVSVTVVFPGAVDTGITANSGVDVPSTMTAGAGRKPPPMAQPELVAGRIIAGMRAGKYRVVVGRDAQALDLLSRVAPQWATALVARQMSALLPPERR